MATVKVWLSGWEQECCGPSRKVGDHVTMSVFLYEGEYYEKRHGYDRRTQDIRGRIEAIEWSPDIVETNRTVGHGTGVPLVKTQDVPGEKHDGMWSLAFTVTTDDPIPVDN